MPKSAKELSLKDASKLFGKKPKQGKKKWTRRIPKATVAYYDGEMLVLKLS